MKLFVHILLVSVVLNLADWPYVDEIFGSAGPVSELMGTKASAPTTQHSGATTHVQKGYQLLLALQALPRAPLRLQAPSREKIPVREVRLALYRVPPLIDRPPIHIALS